MIVMRKIDNFDNRLSLLSVYLECLHVIDTCLSSEMISALVFDKDVHSLIPQETQQSPKCRNGYLVPSVAEEGKSGQVVVLTI